MSESDLGPSGMFWDCAVECRGTPGCLGLMWVPPGRCKLYSSYKLQPGPVYLGEGEYQYMGPRSCGGTGLSLIHI